MARLSKYAHKLLKATAKTGHLFIITSHMLIPDVAI